MTKVRFLPAAEAELPKSGVELSAPPAGRVVPGTKGAAVDAPGKYTLLGDGGEHEVHSRGRARR